MKPHNVLTLHGLPLVLAALLAGTGRMATAAGTCGSDSARFHLLPKTIGSPNAVSRTPYALPCDSMVVPSGQTTTIYGASMLHFGPNPGPASKIVVKGALVIEGKADNPAYLSGSITATEFGLVPGNQAWDGLVVDSGASLRVSHARVFNAPTALVSFSKNVVLKDCYFRGTSGLVLPDTSLFLNPQGQTVDALDLRTGKPHGLAKAVHESRKGSPARPAASGSGRSAALITAGGIGLLAASGVAWWAIQENSKGKGNAVSDAEFEPTPALPAHERAKP